MILSVKDRILILGLLPGKGDIITLRVIKDLMDDIGFQENEIKELSLQTIDGTHRWNQEAEKEKDFNIGSAALGVIASELKKMSDAKELLIEYLDLYDKIVEGKE